MKSRMTLVGRGQGMSWMLALLFVLLCGAPAFAQNNATNILTSATGDDLQEALDGGGTVVLNFNGTITLDNTIYISTNVILDGLTNITISGGGSVPVFEVAQGVTFTVRNLTVSGGKYAGDNGTNGAVGANGGSTGAGGKPGSNGVNAYGGALLNLGTTWAINCIFYTNSAVGGNGGNGGGGGNGTVTAGGGGNGGKGGLAYGGAIYNENTLVLSNCTLAGNFAYGGNGGAGGTNGSGSYAYAGAGGTGGVAAGAALYNAPGANVTILACSFYDNYSGGGSSQAASGSPSNGSGQNGLNGAAAYGGGIYNASSDMIVNSTFYSNVATGGNGGNGGNYPNAIYQGTGGNGGNAYGGSLYNESTGYVAVTNCTFDGGQVFGGTNGLNGPGSYSHGTGSIGTVYGANVDNNGGTFLLKNSILAYPTNTANAYGTITDQGYNLSSDNTPKLSSYSKTNVNPLLGKLGNNGGPTLTLSISPNSLAKDAILDTSAPAFDQRGYPRPNGAYSDIGAIEIGTPQYSVKGWVGVATNGITVVAQGTNGSRSVQTDSSGNYSFGLTPGTYNIIPQATNGFVFDPVSQTVTVPPATNVPAFSATPVYLVGGVISNVTSAINVNVYSTINGQNSYVASTVSSNTGLYYFTNLPAGTYTIIPQTTTTYAFSPPSLLLTIPPQNTNQNFNAVPPAYTVSGQISGVSSPVILVATLGGSTNVFTSTLSDSTGNYSFTTFQQGSYTITPQPTNGYTYNPPNISLSVPPNTNNQNFTATFTPTYSLSGQISNLRQVTSVKAVSSTSTNTVPTDAGGNYKFVSLPAASYTVTPQAVSGLNYSPSSIHLTLSTSTGSQNFTAITTSHSSISSGQVSGNQFSFAISGTPNVVYRIQVSTNLAGPWTDLSTNTAGADGSIAVTNSVTNYPALYFRAVTP